MKRKELTKTVMMFLKLLGLHVLEKNISALRAKQHWVNVWCLLRHHWMMAIRVTDPSSHLCIVASKLISVCLNRNKVWI